MVFLSWGPSYSGISDYKFTELYGYKTIYREMWREPETKPLNPFQVYCCSRGVALGNLRDCLWGSALETSHLIK